MTTSVPAAMEAAGAMPGTRRAKTGNRDVNVLVLAAAALAGALAMLVTTRRRSEKRAAEARERARRRRQRRVPLVSANVRGLQRCDGDPAAPDAPARTERAA